MANLSTVKLQALRSRFGGRIAQVHAAHAEFIGKPPVLIPQTREEVGRAVVLAKAAVDKVAEATATAAAAAGSAAAAVGEVFVRSGTRIASTDLNPEPNAAVVSLEALKRVGVDLQRVTFEPAATVGDIATELRHRALFMPLPDQTSVSMVSAVLSGRRSSFPRSGGAARLGEGVVEADVVLTDGEQAGQTVTLDKNQWKFFQGGGAGVVTRVVLDASLWAAVSGNRWLRAWMVPYAPETFGPLCDELFGGAIPDKVDLGLRASTGAYGARLVVVRATGQGDDASERTRVLVSAAIEKAKCVVLWKDEVRGAGAALSAWVGTGPGLAREDEVNEVTSDDAAWSKGNEAAFLARVDALMAKGAWVNLLMDDVLRRTFVSERVAPPVPTAPATSAVPAAPHSAIAALTVEPAPSEVASVPWLAPTHAGGLIPGFTGEVFERAVDDQDYRDATQHQYAVSSLDAATVARRMRPRLVAVPERAIDVESAVRWAAAQGLKVVARSGGHQYCGLSSGGDDTLLIDLANLRLITPSPDGTRVTVQPGVKLMNLSEALVGMGASVPHGECPLVNLGGHVQTGGVGHQTRSLGLALDWVLSFKMVAWGADGEWKERPYDRPDPANPRKDNDDVFMAVLGGGPGSWGVLTEITFAVFADSALPGARAYGYTRSFPYNRAGWEEAFEQVRLWVERERAGTLPDGVDYFLSVISGDLELLPDANVRPPVLLVETTALAKADEQRILDVVSAVEAKVSWLDKLAAKAIDLFGGGANGPTPLSHIVHNGVRKTGSLGGMPHGREFDLPYKKSVYVTRDPLPPAFCSGFVDLVDRVHRHPATKVVFQGVIGGGLFQENAALKRTRMQHRDALLQLVFDVFYWPGQADVAEAFQDEMRALWEKHLPAEGWRMFWGTYEDKGTGGAQLDMRQLGTQSRYYDSRAEYLALQKVKAAVDPTDVFHTSFTVQLP